MSKAAKILSSIGSGLLLITAGFHTTGLSQASDAANAENAHPFVSMFYEGVWLMPSLTWAIIALLSLWLTFRPGTKSAQTAIVLSLIPLAHAIAIYMFTGPFIGAHMLTLSGGLMLAGALIALRKT